MKKKLWMLGMAIIALTSCTEKEVIDMPEGKPIGFEAMINKTTRATTSNDVADVNNTSINAFYVLGKYAAYNQGDDYSIKNGVNPFSGELFDNLHVTKSGSSWDYVTEDIKQEYWQKGRLYRFAAYANGLGSESDEAMLTSASSVTYNPEDIKETEPDESGNSITVNNGDYLEFTNYLAGSHDLVASIYGDVATNTGLPTSGFTVNFPFKHMLSKIVFDFGTTAAFTYSDLVISDVKITGAHNVATGRMYYHNGNKDITWILPDTNSPGGYVDNTPFKVNVAGSNHLGDYVVFYVIPHENTENIKLEFVVTNYAKGEWSAENPEGATVTTEAHPHSFNLKVSDIAATNSWLPGLMYHYVLRFGTLNDSEPIIFGNPTVGSWSSATQSGGVVLLQGTTGHNE